MPFSASGPSAASRATTGPWPGSTAFGSTSSHGRSTVARSGVPGCGRSSSGSVLTTSSTVTTSTSSVRGPQRTSRTRPAACSSRLPATQPTPRVGPRVVHDQYGVEEVVLLDPAPGRRLVDRRGGDEDVREPGDGSVQVGEPVAEVGAEGQDGARHRCPRRRLPTRAATCRLARQTCDSRGKRADSRRRTCRLAGHAGMIRGPDGGAGRGAGAVDDHRDVARTPAGSGPAACAG